MVCTCVPGVWNSSSPKLNGNIFGRTEKKWNSCTLYFRFVLHYTTRHRWFNGRMRASHARDPDSIPGRCNFISFSRRTHETFDINGGLAVRLERSVDVKDAHGTRRTRASTSRFRCGSIDPIRNELRKRLGDSSLANSSSLFVSFGRMQPA